MEDWIWHYVSPLGAVTLASDGKALTGLWFDDQRFSGCAPDGTEREKPLAVFDETVRWLDVYFGGAEPGFTPPLRLRGTPFQTAVWEALLTIPYGETVSYGALARRIGQQSGRTASARAVGGAVGRNSVSLIVPCHRVVGAKGELTGYAGGLDRKRRLLSLERNTVSLCLPECMQHVR